MGKILEYLAHARDCNAMAGSATSDEHRKLLHEMANTWTTLAREHARMTGQPVPEDTVQDRKEPNPRGLPPAPPKKIKLPYVPVTGR